MMIRYGCARWLIALSIRTSTQMWAINVDWRLWRLNCISECNTPEWNAIHSFIRSSLVDINGIKNWLFFESEITESNNLQRIAIKNKIDCERRSKREEKLCQMWRSVCNHESSQKLVSGNGSMELFQFASRAAAFLFFRDACLNYNRRRESKKWQSRVTEETKERVQRRQLLFSFFFWDNVYS